jgi:hypothetical protein
MELQNAKQVLVEALDIALKKGCYGLNEVNNIVKALDKILELDDIKFEKVIEQ